MKKMPELIKEYSENTRKRRLSFKKPWTEEETYRIAMGKPRKELKEKVKKKKK